MSRRDYRKEYLRDHASPEAKRRRAARNLWNRRLKGKVPAGKEIDHKNPLRSGGGNGMSNIRYRSISANRADNGHEKTSSTAFSRHLRGLADKGEWDKVQDALWRQNQRSGAAVGRFVFNRVRDEKSLNQALSLVRSGQKSAPTWEDFVPRKTKDGKVNPTYLNAMRQMRSKNPKDRVGVQSGGGSKAFEDLLKGGTASTRVGTGTHLQKAAPGIKLTGNKANPAGLWTVPRKKKGRTAGIDRYATARQVEDEGQAAILNFDMPKELVQSDKQIRARIAKGEYSGGGSTDGVEHLIPGSVVRKFGRNFRQKGIVLDPKVPASRNVTLPRNESQRPLIGTARKRATAFDPRSTTRYQRIQSSVDEEAKKLGLNAEERQLLLDLRFAQRDNEPLDLYADLEEVRANRLPNRIKRQLSKIKKDEFTAEEFEDLLGIPKKAAFYRVLEEKRAAIEYRGKTFPGYNKPIDNRDGGQHKKIVLAKQGDKIKMIRFGHRGYGHNISPARKKNYLNRSAGIRDKSGRLTKDNKLSANYWSRRVLWPSRQKADGSARRSK